MSPSSIYAFSGHDPRKSETWAGSFFDMASPLNLTDYKKISVTTWSPKVGAVVRLKLENSADSEQFFEVDANTSVSNSWEVLLYDFSAAPWNHLRR